MHFWVDTFSVPIYVEISQTFHFKPKRRKIFFFQKKKTYWNFKRVFLKSTTLQVWISKISKNSNFILRDLGFGLFWLKFILILSNGLNIILTRWALSTWTYTYMSSLVEWWDEVNMERLFSKPAMRQFSEKWSYDCFWKILSSWIQW